MEVRCLNVEGILLLNSPRPNSVLNSPAEHRSLVILPGHFLMVGRRNLTNPWVHAHMSREPWVVISPTSIGYLSGCEQSTRSERIGSDDTDVHYELGLFRDGACVGLAEATGARGELPDEVLAEYGR